MQDGPSLIQQRIAIDRQRLSGVIVSLGAGVLFIVGAIGLALDPERHFLWIGVIIFGANTIAGVVTLITAESKRRAFEARHGATAGKQDPVR